MQMKDCIAASYAELRPFKPERTQTFPVYPDLVDRLVSTEAHPDAAIAHVMAVCSSYAYSDVETVAMMMARMGLEENHCVMVEEYVDVLFITSTSFLIQSRDGRVVILCYRGTPPTSLITWLTDADIDPAHIDMASPGGASGGARGGAGEGYVHSGFYRNVRATRYEILNALKRAIEGNSVRPGGGKLEHGLQALYITGHSLGGASAAMLALMLVVEPAYREPVLGRCKAVYTFGAPMIASPELARDCNQHSFLRERVIRYVYANDIVPQLPPAESDPFAHFGRGYQYRPKGGEGSWQQNDAPRKQLRNLLSIAAAPLSVFAGDLKLTRRLQFHASLGDHLPQHYITALTPPGVRSEFGD
jgi:lipase (class 3)